MANAGNSSDSSYQKVSNIRAKNGSRVIGAYNNTNNDDRRSYNAPYNNFGGNFTAGRDQHMGNSYTGETINVGGGGRDDYESQEDRDKKQLGKEFPRIDGDKIAAIYGVTGELSKAREMLKLL